MEKYLVKIKKRMAFEALGVIILMPVAIYTMIKYWNIKGVISGTPFKDFLGGMFNGIRSAIVLGFVIYLIFIFIRNFLAIKDSKKLKELYIEEKDERILAINEESSRVTFNISMYVILVASVVSGLYSSAISLTLLSTWVFIMLIRIISIGIISKRI